jgi:hypothetical protein
MPRVPIDYSKTIIYRIVCKDPTITDCYVGSTTDFKSRKTKHKSVCDNDDANVYQFIREHNGWDNFDMIEIEKYNAIDKPDQARRERYWLETYGAILNSYIPSRSRKEYREKNKEQLLEKQKEYYKENKEQLLEKQKEYKKEYYEKNKEQLLEKAKGKMTCVCGSVCNRSDISRHNKSKKHQLFVLNICSNNLCR